jgi:hypothetical protein
MENWHIDPNATTSAETMIQFLAGVCDGSQSWDNCGFSKVDVRLGHSLAEISKKGYPWSVKQAQAAIKLIHKYRKQLGGTQYVDTWLQQPVFRCSPRDKSEKVVATLRKLVSQDKTAVFSFPFDGSLVRNIKVICGSYKNVPYRITWHAESKTWQVPVNPSSISLIMQFAQENGFDIEQRFHDYWDKVRESVLEDTVHLTLSEGYNVSIAGDSLQIAVTDPAILAEFTAVLGESK